MITKFHPFTFKNLRRLRHLDISQNDLRFLEDELLSTNGDVEEIRLDKIGLKAMGRKFFDKLNKLSLMVSFGNLCTEDGMYKGEVYQIRPKFQRCFEAWDVIKENEAKSTHSGDEL